MARTPVISVFLLFLSVFLSHTSFEASLKNFDNTLGGDTLLGIVIPDTLPEAKNGIREMPSLFLAPLGFECLTVEGVMVDNTVGAPEKNILGHKGKFFQPVFSFIHMRSGHSLGQQFEQLVKSLPLFVKKVRFIGKATLCFFSFQKEVIADTSIAESNSEEPKEVHNASQNDDEEIGMKEVFFAIIAGNIGTLIGLYFADRTIKRRR